MSKLLDLVKGTPSYVLAGKGLAQPDLAKAKYTRREAKSGGGYRYFYDNHGQAGKNYSVHKEGASWRSTYHDGDTDHPVGKDGSHDKHPATGSVIGAQYKSKAEAERAISLHSDRQHHAADHGPLNNSNAIGYIRNQIARMPRSKIGPKVTAGNKMLRAIEAGKSQSEALAASGLDAESAKQVYDGLKAFASKYVAAGSVKKAGDNPDLVKGGGPFIGPKGGKWADAKHTIAWKEGKPPSKQRKHAHAGTNKGWHNDHKNTTADEHSALARRHQKLQNDAHDSQREARPDSNAAFDHGHAKDYHAAMASAHRTMAMAKDSYRGVEEYDTMRVNDDLKTARMHQRNHEDSKAASAALRPPTDAKGNAATMGKTGSGNPLEFLSDANFRDHTHGWTASDHSDAAREHSARMDHQYALSDDAQSKGDFEEGARRNSAGRYHKEMAEAHEIKSRNPRKLVTPKTKRKDANLAHSLSAPGGSMADKSAVPFGHHQIAERNGPRTVKTSHKSGLYHVHSLGGSHSVTHGPSGMSAGHHKTKAKAVAAAKHMDAVAGDAGHDAEFGKNPSKAALTRMANAHSTIP